MRRLLVVFLAFCALPAGAETAAGLWLTGPDQKGQVGHVRMAPCGPSFCGTVVKAIDKSGHEVKTPNVGKQVIWDVKPVGGGNYAGKMYVSHFKATVAGKFKIAGPNMTVKGCLGPVCQSQVWKRLN